MNLYLHGIGPDGTDDHDPPSGSTTCAPTCISPSRPNRADLRANPNLHEGRLRQARILVMRIITSKVVGGQLEVPEGALREGDTVTLLVPESDESGFHLPEDLQEELRLALAEASRGDTVDGWQLLNELKQ